MKNLKSIAEEYIKPFRHKLRLGEEDGLLNDLVGFGEHLMSVNYDGIVDLDKELQDREDIMYKEGIEFSVIVFNDAKEVAENYAENKSEHLIKQLKCAKLALLNTVEFIENNICTKWSGIKEAKEIIES